MAEPLLAVRDLRVDFPRRQQAAGAGALQGVAFDLASGEAVALVGPSGSGKTLTARAVLGLLPGAARWSGTIAWKGRELTDPRGSRWRNVRGRGMTLILQEPQTSLNPVLRVGDQIAETVIQHTGCSRRDAWRRAVELLDRVQVPQPELKAGCWPHQLSGGMRQRVLLACALACPCELLIADEPTTALDLTIQKEILGLIREIRQERNLALLFITHNLDLVPLLTDRTIRLADGRVVGAAAASELRGPRPGRGRPGAQAAGTGPVYRALAVSVSFQRRAAGWRERSRGPLWPVREVDLELWPGRALGLAGESGSGKTTLARALSGHLPLAAGRLELAGRAWRLPAERRRVQLVFQDPAGSLNPRQTVGEALIEAGRQAGPLVDPAASLAEVGLDPGLSPRLPHELSGGQRQRVALARCLAADPQVLIADEPTSALDSASRDRILNLLAAIMSGRDLALLLIAHDPQVLHRVCSQVMVMYGGIVLEVYPVAGAVRPAHPYTRSLHAAAPACLTREMLVTADASRAGSVGQGEAGAGCPWFAACGIRKPTCAKELPPLVPVGPEHLLRCPEAKV